MLKGFRCCSLNAVLLIRVCGQLFTKCFVSCGSLSYKTSDGPTEIPLSGAPFTKFYCRTLPPGSLYASPNPFTGFSGRGFITTQVRMSAQALHYQGNSSSPTSGDCISSWNRLAGLSRCGFSLSSYAPSKSWFAWRTHEECVLKDSSPNSNLLHLGLANGFRHLVYILPEAFLFVDFRRLVKLLHSLKTVMLRNSTSFQLLSACSRFTRSESSILRHMFCFKS